MTSNQPHLPYNLSPDDKISQLMVYTDSSIVWGEVITKTAIRVSTWLRTNAAPDSISIFNARVLQITSNQPRPIAFSEIHVSAPQVLGYHLIPPARDPLDYDDSEPNRKMEPVSVVVNFFRFDGHLRMASKATLRKYVEVTREAFTSLYDVEVYCPVMPSLKPMKVPYVQVRQANSMFAYVNPPEMQ